MVTWTKEADYANFDKMDDKKGIIVKNPEGWDSNTQNIEYDFQSQKIKLS